MPFFQGAYDFDISGPVQMNDGSAVGHVLGAGQNPSQNTQHVQPQQNQKNAPAQQQAPPPAHPQIAVAPVAPSFPPANATLPTSAPMLIPVQSGAQPQYLFPGNPQPYMLVYAPVPTQGGVLAPVQAGYPAQPAQAPGVPYYLIPQGGYQVPSYLTPPPIPNGLDNRSLATSASSIGSEYSQQGTTAVPSPSLSHVSPFPVNHGFTPNGSSQIPAPSPPPGTALLTPPASMLNGSHTPGAPFPSNSSNHSATSFVGLPVPGAPTPVPIQSAQGFPGAPGVHSVPGGGGQSLATMPSAVPHPVFASATQPIAIPLPAPQVAPTTAAQASNYPKRKKKSWFSRLFKKKSSKKST